MRSKQREREKRERFRKKRENRKNRLKLPCSVPLVHPGCVTLHVT